MLSHAQDYLFTRHVQSLTNRIHLSVLHRISMQMQIKINERKHTQNLLMQYNYYWIGFCCFRLHVMGLFAML